MKLFLMLPPFLCTCYALSQVNGDIRRRINGVALTKHASHHVHRKRWSSNLQVTNLYLYIFIMSSHYNRYRDRSPTRNGTSRYRNRSRSPKREAYGGGMSSGRYSYGGYSDGSEFGGYRDKKRWVFSQMYLLHYILPCFSSFRDLDTYVPKKSHWDTGRLQAFQKNFYQEHPNSRRRSDVCLSVYLFSICNYK